MNAARDDFGVLTALTWFMKAHAAMLYDFALAKWPDSEERSEFLSAAHGLVTYDELHRDNSILSYGLLRFAKAARGIDPYGFEGVSTSGLAELITAIKAKHRARLS